MASLPAPSLVHEVWRAAGPPLGSWPLSEPVDFHFGDFTEDEYRRVLKLAKERWRFIRFPEYRSAGRLCLWRHDIDLSVHRAHRLARIEAEEGVRSTYFVHLHNEFYNPLELEVTRLLIEVHRMGHDLGLHFDLAFYENDERDSTSVLERLRLERQILQDVLGVDIAACSFHNPDLTDAATRDADELGGMVNAYGQYMRVSYSYVSDSNGYWRFRRLRDVLEAGKDERLHVLTHPGWWTPEPMSPRARIARCIDGRAASQHRRYDEFLARAGRKNVQ